MTKDVPAAHEQTVLSEGGTSTRKPEQTTSLTAGELIGERYRVVELLGAGAQGEVWRADDVEIEGHVVALKILAYRATSPEGREQALRELRMLAAINHPSVVQFKGHGWLGGRLWFAMPWYEGRDLESSMPLDRAEARRVFETLAGGLAAVHAKGLRHQDIKPSNIFLAKIAGLEQTMPVLLDFGVAAKDGEELIAGSPDYFAPELAAGWPTTANLGPEADVFSLALALRNVLEPDTAPSVGAFDKPSLEQRAKVAIEPPKSKDLAFLAPSFRRWLAIEPEKRPTAKELVGELTILTAPEDHALERRRLLRRVGPWALVVLIATAVGGWFAWNAVVDARKAQAAEAAQREAEAARADVATSTAEEAVARATASSARTEDALRRLDDAEAQIGAAEGDVTAMRVARDALRAALHDARAELVTSQTALADTQSRVATLTSQLTEAQRTVQTTRSELDATRTALASTITERDTARTELATRTAERDTARSDVTTITGERDTARADLETERAGRAADRDAASSAHATLEARLHELEARIRELEARPTPAPDLAPSPDTLRPDPLPRLTPPASAFDGPIP